MRMRTGPDPPDGLARRREPEADCYLRRHLPDNRNQAFVDPYNSATFVYLADLDAACQLILCCVQLRPIGVNCADFSVAPAEFDAGFYTKRLTGPGTIRITAR